MPIDVVKVRLQMQGADGTRQYKGILDAAVVTARKEGLGALWKGLPPALVRQVRRRGSVLRAAGYSPASAAQRSTTPHCCFFPPLRLSGRS